MKVLTLEDLTKAAGGLGAHFGKAAAFHKGKAAAHETLHKHHSEMASFAKGKHDAMDDGHEMKAYMGKVHEHHTAKATHHLDLHKLHKAHAEDHQAMADTYNADKAAGTTAPAAGAVAAAPTVVPNAGGATPAEGLKGMLDQTTTALVGKALESLNSDPKVAEAIQKMVLEQVQAALGNKIVPDHVRGVMPEDARGGSAVTMVPRPGAAEPTDTSKIDPAFKHLVEV